MKQDAVITVLQALASPARLDVYRLLVRTGAQGMVAGEIGQTLGVPPTNLSFHLKALTQAGLLKASAEGRYQRYRADIPSMLALIGYLTEECCAGRPEDCLPAPSGNVCLDAALARHELPPE